MSVEPPGFDLAVSAHTPMSFAKPSLVDTTMLYAPLSGGVKRYLSAKADWLSRHRPGLRHSQVLPGPADGEREQQTFVHAAAVPFARGYRWPLNLKTWIDRIIAQGPSLIEAQDPYLPGKAALRAGAMLGIPVVGFCHTDPASLAGLPPKGRRATALRKLWARAYRPYDQVLAPSHYMADVLADSGLANVAAMRLGVDTSIFRPRPGARTALFAALGLDKTERLLVFAGRAAPEKRVDVLVGAVEALGAPYRLLLVGAVAPSRSDRVLTLPFQNEAGLARILAGCDALVHANPYETLGLIVLEAMACGLPVVGVAHGGVGETVDEAFGQLAYVSTPKHLAEAIAALFRRDLAVLRASARARALERHRWDDTFANLTVLYGRMTGMDAFVCDPDGGGGHQGALPCRAS